MPLDVLDHEDRGVLELGAEIRTPPEHGRVRGVLSFGHRFLTGVHPAKKRKGRKIQCEEYNGNFVQIEPITKRNFVAIINVIRRLRRDNGDVIDNSGGGGVSSSKYNNRYYVITLRFVSRRRDSLLPRERNFQFNPLPLVDGERREEFSFNRTRKLAIEI